MLPTLNGRIQTRIFMLATLGAPDHRCCSPRSCPATPTTRRRTSSWPRSLVLGVVWELIYHRIQQFRWEKDWPTLFGFITVRQRGRPGLAAPRARGRARHRRDVPVLRVPDRLPGHLDGDLGLGQRSDAGAVHPLALLRWKDHLMDPTERTPSTHAGRTGRRSVCVPSSGSGTLARLGNVILLVGSTDPSVVSPLLAQAQLVAANGGQGRQLVRGFALLLGSSSDDLPAFVALAPHDHRPRGPRAGRCHGDGQRRGDLRRRLPGLGGAAGAVPGQRNRSHGRRRGHPARRPVPPLRRHRRGRWPRDHHRRRRRHRRDGRRRRHTAAGRRRPRRLRPDAR